MQQPTTLTGANWDLRWHERRAKLSHLKWFENLCDLHQLTLSWIEDLKITREQHALSRGLSSEAIEHLWMLESLRDTRLDVFLDDTSPDDLLRRLDHTIWAVQATTLSQVTTEAAEATRAVLEQSSFRFGRQLTETRWKDAPFLGSARAQLALAALRDSPFSGQNTHPGFLVRRVLNDEFQFLWRSCPHSNRYPEVERTRDLHCHLHTQALRGMLYTFNPRLELTYENTGECLIQCKTHAKNPTV